MSPTHNWLGSSAMKTWRVTRCLSTTAHRSSWTGGPGLPALPFLGFAEGAPPAVGRADAPCRPLGHGLTGLGCLVDEEPVPELGVLAVGVEQRVGSVGLDQFGVGDRARQPAVVGLAGDPEYPARHRDGNPVSGQLADERVHHFPGGFACER